jgi:hypothetical protein
MPKAKIEADNHANGMELDPLIEALLEHLPAPGDYFSQDDRKLWLQILELSLKLIYSDQPEAEAHTDPSMHGH